MSDVTPETESYKSYSITVYVQKLDYSAASRASFNIYRELGEYRERVHMGSVQEHFATPDDARRAGVAAARAWIDQRSSGN